MSEQRVIVALRRMITSPPSATLSSRAGALTSTFVKIQAGSNARLFLADTKVAQSA
jgi:hypothetical protein